MDLADFLRQADPNAANNATASGGAAADPPATPVILAGKYQGQTVEEAAKELEKGYGNLLTSTTTISEENKTLKARLEAITPLLENLSSGRGHGGGDQAPTKGAAEVIAEAMNVDVSVVRQAIAEQAREAATELLDPFFRGISSQQIVTKEAPGYQQFAPEISQFLEANPVIKARVEEIAKTKMPEAAHKYAYLEFLSSRGSFVSNNATSQPDPSGQAAAEARLDAALPGGVSGRSGAAAQATFAQLEAKARSPEATSEDITAYLSEFMKPFAHPGSGTAPIFPF